MPRTTTADFSSVQRSVLDAIKPSRSDANRKEIDSLTTVGSDPIVVSKHAFSALASPQQGATVGHQLGMLYGASRATANVRNSKVALAYGDVLMRTGRFHEALRQYHTAMNAGLHNDPPRFAAALVGAGMSLCWSHPDQAFFSAEKALQQCPIYPRAWALKALALSCDTNTLTQAYDAAHAALLLESQQNENFEHNDLYTKDNVHVFDDMVTIIYATVLHRCPSEALTVRAQALLEATVKNDPSNSFANYALADLLCSRGERERAMQLLDTALESAPFDANASRLKAILLSDNGDTQKKEHALSLAQQLTQREPNSPLAWQTLAEVAQRCSEGAESSEKAYQMEELALTKMQQLGATTPSLRLQQEQFYRRTGRMREAHKLTADSNKTPRYGVMRAISAVQLGQFSEAIKEIEIYHGTEMNTDSLIIYGQALAGLGKHAEACTAFLQVLACEPNHVMASCALHRSRDAIEVSKRDTAAQQVEASIATSHTELSRAALLERLDILVTQYSKDARFWTYRGEVRTSLDMYAQARIDFAEALRLEPNNSRSLAGDSLAARRHLARRYSTFKYVTSELMHGAHRAVDECKSLLGVRFDFSSFSF